MERQREQPRPGHATDPAACDLWKYHRRFTCTWLRQTDDHPHYRELKVLLDDHADQLAIAIDDTLLSRQVAESSAQDHRQVSLGDADNLTTLQGG